MAGFVEALMSDPGLDTEIFNRYTMSVSMVRE